MKLRQYQHDAVEKVFEAFESHRSALVVMPTGTGKTVLFSEVIRRWPEFAITRSPWAAPRVLVIAHREELIRQAADKIKRVTGAGVDIEMADQFAARDSMFGAAPVVVASKDTLHEKRLKRFRPDEFGLIITDEAHHAVAQTYRRVYDYFPEALHLGVTATPDRTDEEALGQVFETVAFVYEITDAINDGWLVPIRANSISVEGLDFSNVRTTAGDLNGKDLADELAKFLQQLAFGTVRAARWNKTLVFCDAVANAERLAEIINRPGTEGAPSLTRARWICGKTDRDVRAQTLRDYSAGAFQFLVNVGVFTEGFDEPTIGAVSLGRPTESRSLFAQMVGRGTRPLPGIVDSCGSAEERRAAIAASVKPAVDVLDFVGNAGKHKLVTVADILGGNHSEAAVERAQQAAAAESQKTGRPVDMAAALDKAEHDIAAEREERRRREEERRRHLVPTGGRVESKSVDPFDALDIEPVREYAWDRTEKATPAQVWRIKNEGYPIPPNLSKRRASQIISGIIARQAKLKPPPMLRPPPRVREGVTA